MRRWKEAFAGYRHNITDAVISDWLQQFGKERDVGARLLDVVDFYSWDRITNGFRSALSSLPNWNTDPNQRIGKWRFAAMSRSAGESGDAMLHRFRVANRLDGAKYSELFIHPSQILLADLGAEDSLVLVDDFIGTGDSVCKAWDSSYAELVPDVGKVYLIVVAAVADGLKLVHEKTAMTCIPANELGEADNFFSDKNGHFTDEEKKAVLARCKKAMKAKPKGYGDCGLVLTFAHRCPNNALPVLHANHDKWIGLFPRHG